MPQGALIGLLFCLPGLAGLKRAPPAMPGPSISFRKYFVVSFCHFPAGSRGIKLSLCFEPVAPGRFGGLGDINFQQGIDDTR
jgi:hypothetical protein